MENVTFEEAVGWYKSGRESLKKKAVKYYEEYKLRDSGFLGFKTFQDVLDHFWILPGVIDSLPGKEYTKVALIQNALNSGQIKGNVWKSDFYYSAGLAIVKREYPESRLLGKMLISGDKYFIYEAIDHPVSIDFVPLGIEYESLFRCKTKEIASYMCKKFYKEMIDLVLVQSVLIYEFKDLWK